jgi:hypothetical protein
VNDASVVSTKTAIRLVLDAWRDRGWYETGGATRALVNAHATGSDMIAAVPVSFTVRNACDARTVAAAATAALVATTIQLDRPTIVNPEEIDSFAKVADVSARDVANIERPLPIPEREVKRMLLTIIGEAEFPGDWGGERSDAFSTNVYLDGDRTTASFVLKGPSKRGELTPADYGANGDQLQRSFTQPASLHVIQANASLATSVRELVNGLVLNARSKGDAGAVATIWDGTDTARILAAYGFINPADGQQLQ